MNKAKKIALKKRRKTKAKRNGKKVGISLRHR